MWMLIFKRMKMLILRGLEKLGHKLVFILTDFVKTSPRPGADTVPTIASPDAIPSLLPLTPSPRVSVHFGCH